MLLIDFCSHPINVCVVLISCMGLFMQVTSHYLTVWSEGQNQSVSLVSTPDAEFSLGDACLLNKTYLS